MSVEHTDSESFCKWIKKHITSEKFILSDLFFFYIYSIIKFINLLILQETMKKEQFMNVNENLSAGHVVYEPPTCTIVELQSEGSLLTASGTGNTIDDLYMEEWY